jgi:hypothetical protein
MSTMPMNSGQYGQPVMQDISRQRQMAEQLRKQGAEQLQGQMVSGIYVAPSFTQQLAKVLQSYQAGNLDRSANKAETEYNTNKNKKLAEIIADNKPKQMEGAPTITSTMPAYEPSQQDRFGSPMQGVQREPVVTSTPNFTQETPDQVRERQQGALLNYMGEFGDAPQTQYLLGQMNKQDDRAYAKGEKLDDRTYTDTREEKLYNRGRQDKLTDIEAERKYNDIVRDMQNKFTVSQQDRQFANQYQMQMQSQSFAAGQQTRNQQFTAGENQKTRDNVLKVAEGKAKSTPLSAAGQKEVFESDEIAQSSKNAIGMLQEAKTLNKQAYSGFGAKTRALVRSNIPFSGESTGANATVDLDNLMTGQALESLKATFGGMPTEGERKILLEMQASADKTPAQREAILNRAIEAADRRVKFNEQKARSLRDGSYFNPQQNVQPQGGASGGWSITPVN